MARRGRPRTHEWLLSKDLKNSLTPEAQYLKWSSANNTALQTVAATGCPRCHGVDFELRHDKKYQVIRFHCTSCRHETSYRVKMPRPSSFEVIQVFMNGVQVGEKTVDHYHPATERQRSDVLVSMAARSIERGMSSLGGEWFVDNVVRGAHNQKRYYSSFDEFKLLCRWNRMQAEHEKRLSELERDMMM